MAGSLDLGAEFYIPYDFCKLKSPPVWDFQGAQDATVNPDEAQTLIQALTNCGRNAKINLYPDAGHITSVTLAYDGQGLYDLFLTQSQ